MLILGKSALNKEQILDRLSKGCTSIEVHLSNEWTVLDSSLELTDICKEFNNLIGMVDIRAVHVPHLEMSLEVLVSSKYEPLFVNACKVAQACANRWGHKVLVVVHTETCFDFMKRANNFLSSVRDRTLSILDKYPDVELGIENVIPLEFYGDDYHLRSGVLDDSFKFAESFNDERIGTVLDICHLKITDIYLRRFDKSGLFSSYSYEKMIELHKNAKLVHLSTFEGAGYYDEHALPITEWEEMLEFCRQYKKYSFSCPITIEVNENNYLDAQNYLSTRNLFNECWKEVK